MDTAFSPVKATSSSAPLTQRVMHMMAAQVAPGARLCVGLSGGVDSVVLLDVLHALAPRFQWQLSALHVNHQLSANAAAWAAFCRRFCRERDIPLRVVKVQVAQGNSIEGAARAARYVAYRKQRAERIVLAQHQDDQAETVLLQLLRGAGVKGLAAMPAVRNDTLRGELRVLRPLLDISRAEIETCAAARGLAWITDESNASSYFLRNFLRLEILPRVAERVPAYRRNLARAAGHLAEAAQLLDALAQLDGVDALKGASLTIDVLQGLPPARARNLLRYYLALQGVAMPDARRLNEALRQVVEARRDAQVCVVLGTHALRRFQGELYVLPPQAPAAIEPVTLTWRGERKLEIHAWDGVLQMRPRRGSGIRRDVLAKTGVEIRARAGGEKLQPDATRPRRPVKDLFQAQGVPPWQRDRVPFLWAGKRLVWVAGLGVDCAFAANPGESGLVPQWTTLNA